MKGSSLKFNVHSPGGRHRQRGRQTDRQTAPRQVSAHSTAPGAAPVPRQCQPACCNGLLLPTDELCAA